MDIGSARRGIRRGGLFFLPDIAVILANRA